MKLLLYLPILGLLKHSPAGTIFVHVTPLEKKEHDKRTCNRFF